MKTFGKLFSAVLAIVVAAAFNFVLSRAGSDGKTYSTASLFPKANADTCADGFSGIICASVSWCDSHGNLCGVYSGSACGGCGGGCASGGGSGGSGC
ncbi:MAG: hypothetical protein HYT12_00835 [Candidatus Liptonbacteria bacterium]|nr:hypothetical protein [Candidatus Liptonbacteria bacterium]